MKFTTKNEHVINLLGPTKNMEQNAWLQYFLWGKLWLGAIYSSWLVICFWWT